MGDLSEHFSKKEWMVSSPKTENFTVYQPLVDQLEVLREQVGKRNIKITSGNRTWEDHVRVYKQMYPETISVVDMVADLKKKVSIPRYQLYITLFSYHVSEIHQGICKAADITVPGMRIEDVYILARDLFTGVYCRRKAEFVHVDMRDAKFKWDGGIR